MPARLAVPEAVPILCRVRFGNRRVKNSARDVARVAPEFALIAVVLAVATPLRLVVGAHAAPEFGEVGEEFFDDGRAIELLHSGELAADPVFAGVAAAQKVDLDALLVRGDERQAEEFGVHITLNSSVKMCENTIASNPMAGPLAFHLEFLRTVASMHRVALLNRNGTNDGPASDEYITHLGELIPPRIPPNRSTFVVRQNVNKRFPSLNLMFAGEHDTIRGLPGALQVELLSLGLLLFRGISVRMRDDIETIYDMDDWMRHADNMYIELILSLDRPDVPLGILNVARNIKVWRSFRADNFTEQNLFDILRQKLADADERRCRVIIELPYTNAGQANFEPIVAACRHTRFRGYILCLIQQGTVIQYTGRVVRTVGRVDGVSISIINASSVRTGPDEPLGFRRFNSRPTRVLRIER